MSKYRIIFLVFGIFLLIIIGGIVGLQLYFADHKTKTSEWASNTPEVSAFYEKYGDVARDHLDLNGMMFTAYGNDTTGMAILNYYAGPVKSAPRVSFECRVGDTLDIPNYTVDENVLEYIQNYNCFTDKYP